MSDKPWWCCYCKSGGDCGCGGCNNGTFTKTCIEERGPVARPMTYVASILAVRDWGASYLCKHSLVTLEVVEGQEAEVEVTRQVRHVALQKYPTILGWKEHHFLIHNVTLNKPVPLSEAFTCQGCGEVCDGEPDVGGRCRQCV